MIQPVGLGDSEEEEGDPLPGWEVREALEAEAQEGSVVEELLELAAPLLEVGEIL